MAASAEKMPTLLAGIAVPSRSPMARHNGSYTDEDRRTAVATWLVLGNVERSAERLGMPAPTLYQWKQQPWWSEMLRGLRTEDIDAIDARFTGYIHKALDEVGERLENGNEVRDSKGNLHRQKVSCRDAAITLAILFDKRQLLRAQPTAITERGDAHLEGLAGRLVGLLERAPGNASNIIEQRVERIADTVEQHNEAESEEAATNKADATNAR